MDNMNVNTTTNLSQEDLKILQKISIALRGMSFLVDNGKTIMENYLFIDCGEKLNPNNVLQQCYHQYSSISGKELEYFASKIDKICFPLGFDINSSIFDEIVTNDNRRDLFVKENEKETNNDNSYDYGYNRTIYKLGHLSMNPTEEPFLGEDA